jgi:hypothetical protein
MASEVVVLTWPDWATCPCCCSSRETCNSEPTIRLEARAITSNRVAVLFRSVQCGPFVLQNGQLPQWRIQSTDISPVGVEGQRTADRISKLRFARFSFG